MPCSTAPIIAISCLISDACGNRRDGLQGLPAFTHFLHFIYKSPYCVFQPIFSERDHALLKTHVPPFQLKLLARPHSDMDQRDDCLDMLSQLLWSMIGSLASPRAQESDAHVTFSPEYPVQIRFQGMGSPCHRIKISGTQQLARRFGAPNL